MAAPQEIVVDGVTVKLEYRCPTFLMLDDGNRKYHVTIFTETSRNRKGSIMFHITRLRPKRSEDEHYFFSTDEGPTTPDNPCGIMSISAPPGERNHPLDELNKIDPLAVIFLKKNWRKIYEMI